MSFALFILTNAVHFLQPAVFYPELESISLYQVMIVACFLVSIFAIFRQLEPQALVAQPITLFVFGLLVAVVLSHLARSNIYDARMSAYEFAKVVLYYLLFVSLVTSLSRLRQFTLAYVTFAMVLTVLGLLQFHGVINIAALTMFERVDYNEITGMEIMTRRLRSIGVFQDPNDLCLLLATSILISLYWMGERRLGGLRVLWLIPLGIFGYAVALTQSRSGLVATAAGLMVLFRARYGTWKTIFVTLASLPVLFLVFGGRMTDFGNAINEDSGQSRIQLWSDGLIAFREHPIFGIGQGLFADEVGNTHVAHNSYLHCFTELGFVGGLLFLGAFFYAVWTLYQLGAHEKEIGDPELRRLRPFVLAMVAAYATGMLALSRAYVPPTYMILGIATVYLRMAGGYATVPVPRFNLGLLQRAAVVSVAFLGCLYIFVRLFARWS